MKHMRIKLVFAALLVLALCLTGLALAEETPESMVAFPEGMTWSDNVDTIQELVGDAFKEKNESTLVYDVPADEAFGGLSSFGIVAFDSDNTPLMVTRTFYNTDDAFYEDVCARIEAICGPDATISSIYLTMMANAYSTDYEKAAGYKAPDGSVLIAVTVPSWSNNTAITLISPELVEEAGGF